MAGHDDLMTIAQTCEYLHMSKGALAQLRYTGKGPRYMAPTPKQILYKRAWIDEWLKASERTGTSNEILAM
jgi:hypothetical protein